MDINKIPLNRWTWWNMSICLYVCIYFYIYTRINYISTNLYSMSIYFFDIWEPKAFIYTFTQQTPKSLTFFESTISLLQKLPPKLRDHHGSQIDQEGTSKGSQSCHLTPSWRSLNPMERVTQKTPKNRHLLEEPRWKRYMFVPVQLMEIIHLDIDSQTFGE